MLCAIVAFSPAGHELLKKFQSRELPDLLTVIGARESLPLTGIEAYTDMGVWMSLNMRAFDRTADDCGEPVENPSNEFLGKYVVNVNEWYMREASPQSPKIPLRPIYEGDTWREYFEQGSKDAEPWLAGVLKQWGKGEHACAAAMRCSLEDFAAPFVVDVSLDRTRLPKEHSLAAFNGHFFTASLKFPESDAASATVVPSPTSGIPVDADA
jgi:hypothetical protein